MGNLGGSDGGELELLGLCDGEEVDEVVVGGCVKGRVGKSLVEDGFSSAVIDALLEQRG